MPLFSLEIFFFFLAIPCALQHLSRLGIEPGPLQWKPGILTTSPGKSLKVPLLCVLCFYIYGDISEPSI